jgi:oligosaccharide repeat unit polymerase
VLALAVGVGGLVPLVRPDVRDAAIAFLGVLTLAPIVFKLARHSLDVFEPLVTVGVSLAVMFVVRPSADLLLGITNHIGYDVMATFDQALLVAIVGVSGFQIGYALSTGRALARVTAAPSVNLRAQYAIRFALTLAFVGYALYAVFIAQTGGISTLTSLLSGRGSGPNQLYVGSTGYLYDALLLTAPAALILLGLALRYQRPTLALLAIVVAGPQLVLATATGVRTDLLIFLGGGLLLLYLARQRRPSFSAALIALIIFTVGISFLREFRTAGSAFRDQGLSGLLTVAANPNDQLILTFGGSDNEMFDSLANELLVVPAVLPFAPGSTVGDLFIRAVPRPLWPAKPLERNDAVVAALWPANYAAQRASPAFSVVGPLYADSGYLGVFVGMVLFGLFAKAVWAYFLNHQHRLTAQLIYASTLPLMVVFLRGTLPDTLSYVLFVIAPLIAVDRVAGMRREARVRQPHV